MSTTDTWRNIWRRVTAPDDTVVEPEDRYHSRLLMSLLLSVLPLGWVAGLLPAVLGVAEPMPDNYGAVVLLGGLVWLAAFVLARRGHHQVATFLAVLAGLVVVFITTVLDRNDRVLMYLLLPVVVSSALLPLRKAVWVAVTAVVAIPVSLYFAGATPFIPQLFEPMVLLTVGTTLVFVAARHRRMVALHGQTALRDSEERYRDLFHSTFDGIVVHDEGRIVSANQGLADILHTTPEGLKGSLIDDWLSPDSRRALHHALKEQRTDPLDVSGRRANGEDFHAEVVLRRGSRQSSLGGGLIAVRDVTDRRRAEEHLHEAQRLDSVGLLAGGVAHDYNNILMVIMGSASVAKEIHRNGGDVTQLLEAITSAAERARTLTDQLLAYAGHSVVQRVPQDVAAILEEQRPLLESALPHNVWLELMPGDELPSVDCDATQLGQVVMNVVMNGAESMAERGGAVTIQVRAEYLDDGAFDSLGGTPLESGRYVVIEIRDSGSGIDEETLGRMFEPFYTTKPKGHGLGLAAAAGVVRAHRGGVRVDSAVGEGTTVSVALPAIAAAVEPAAATIDTSDEMLRNITVMVVDDEPAVLDTVKALLETVDLTVVTAASGAEAVSLYRQERDSISAVVLDLKMPVMDGKATFHALREVDPTVRVLFASGFSEPGTIKDLLHRGEASFIRKPFRLDELVAAIESVLPGRISDPQHRIVG